MDGVSKSSSPFVVRFYDGTELVIPDELISFVSIMVSARLTRYAVDALKRIVLNSENL